MLSNVVTNNMFLVKKISLLLLRLINTCVFIIWKLNVILCVCDKAIFILIDSVTRYQFNIVFTNSLCSQLELHPHTHTHTHTHTQLLCEE